MKKEKMQKISKRKITARGIAAVIIILIFTFIIGVMVKSEDNAIRKIAKIGVNSIKEYFVSEITTDAAKNISLVTPSGTVRASMHTWETSSGEKIYSSSTSTFGTSTSWTSYGSKSIRYLR